MSVLLIVNAIQSGLVPIREDNKWTCGPGRFLHYSVNKEDHASDVVLSIVGYQEQLAIASYDGVYLFHPETATFTLLTNELAHYLKIDSKGSLWIAVEGKGVYCYNMTLKSLRFIF